MNNIIDMNKTFDIEDIFKAQQILMSQPNALIGDAFPLKHEFVDGLYIRTIYVPAGGLVVTKMFKQPHATFLMSGEVFIATVNGLEGKTGPCHWITEAGVKRVIYCQTDVEWTTIHANPTNEKDLDKIEDFVIDSSLDKIYLTNDEIHQIGGNV